MNEKKPSQGTLFLNRERYWWRGVLPGETKRKAIPLRPVGSRYATKDPYIAQQLAEDLINRHLYSTDPVAGTVPVKTIAELVRHYLAYAKRYYKSNEPGNIKYALAFLVNHYPSLQVEDFGPLKIKQLRQSMITEKDWVLGVINQRVSMIVRMFKWAASEQFVPIHVYQSLSTVETLHKGRSEARESKRVMPVSAAHVEAILPYQSQTVADMVRVQQYTGMRSSEVCQIRPGDIDRSGEVWLYCPQEFKTDHLEDVKIVPLGPKAQAVLRKYLFREPGDYCFTPAQAEAERGRITHNLRPLYNKDSYRRAVIRAISAANGDIKKQCQAEDGDGWEKLYKSRRVPDWTPHQLRHSHATLIRREEGIEAARASLGHKRVTTTEIYAEKDLRMAIESAKKFG